MRFSDFSLKSNKSIGAEICPQGIFFAVMKKKAGVPFLEKAAFRPFQSSLLEGADFSLLQSGVLKPSLRETNILDPQAFCDCLKEARSLFSPKEPRLSISLPDSVGRVFLMDIEGRFKSRGEAMDVIRWKLKKSVSFNTNDAHLDYQQLMIRENNEMSLLVAMVSKNVITQYEDLITSAGFLPVYIDLNVFSLFRTFENYPALQRDVALILYYRESLTIMAMNGGIPEFIRIKDITETPANGHRVYREICNSFMAYRERFPERVPNKLFCLAEPDTMSSFCEMVAEATGNETSPLKIETMVKPRKDPLSGQQTLFSYTAAIGAALRNL